jgi:hypothetical protein
MSENTTGADNQQERLNLSGWVVGFVDGEGSFTVSIFKNPTATLGWQVFPEFVVTQGAKSKEVLYLLKDFFLCGQVYLNKRHDNHREDLYRYCVRSAKDLTSIIIPFFEKNPLRTAKLHDFHKFSRIMKIVGRREHLTFKGMERIANIAMSMNRKIKPGFLESPQTIRRT